MKGDADSLGNVELDEEAKRSSARVGHSPLPPEMSSISAAGATNCAGSRLGTASSHAECHRTRRALGGVVVLLTVTTALLPGCGGGTASYQRHSDGGDKASVPVGAAEETPGSAASDDPATPVVVRRCPSASAVSQAVGIGLKRQDLGEGDCAYLSPDRSNSGIGIEVVHPHNAFRDLTTLAAARRQDRFGGGTAETESAEADGGHITSFLQDTPQYGPGTFRAGENIVGTDTEKLQSCDFFVLGTDGYPASVQAEAQKGGVYSYKGAVSQAEVCGWATAILELAIAR